MLLIRWKLQGEGSLPWGLGLPGVSQQSHGWRLKDGLFLRGPGIRGSPPHPRHACGLAGGCKACGGRWCSTRPQSDEEVGKRLPHEHPHPLPVFHIEVLLKSHLACALHLALVNALADDLGVSKRLVWLPRVRRAPYTPLPRAQDRSAK